MRDELRSILAEDFLGDLTALDMDELRTRRASCRDVETGLSYLRRLAQGRLDVATAEMQRRADGGGEEDMEALIARLPQLLAGSTRAPGTGRLPADLGPGRPDGDLADALDQIAADANLDDPGHASDETLHDAARRLADFEREVSDLRRRLFDRIDALEAELTRRYKSGEASVDSLLR